MIKIATAIIEASPTPIVSRPTSVQLRDDNITVKQKEYLNNQYLSNKVRIFSRGEMNKIIFVAVLLVAVSAIAASATKSEIDEAKFEKCLEDDFGRQLEVEIPAELMLAREYFDARGIDKAWHEDLIQYKATLSDEQQKSLVKAANKYVDETVAVLFDSPCAQLEDYTQWSAHREPKDTVKRKELFRFKNLAIHIVAFLGEDNHDDA